ncbi:hypothetical protein, partial [Lishizhenia sp.]|uniref:hypothetical protein n=1 Tax=Lishizhenia sp. TaxID=2497594 RepID=UPI00299D86A2
MFKFITLLFCCVHSLLLLAQTERISIDFGGTNSPFPWNNLNNASVGSLNSLMNNYGYATSIGITVTDAFTGVNSSGTQTPSASVG